MKVRLLTGLSTGSGSHEAGDVLDIADDAMGRALIERDLAIAVHDPAPEAAMLAGMPEQATLPRPRTRGV
jgi:hypothetical protein